MKIIKILVLIIIIPIVLLITIVVNIIFTLVFASQLETTWAKDTRKMIWNPAETNWRTFKSIIK